MRKILFSPATPGLLVLYWQLSPNFRARRADVQLTVIHDVEGRSESGIATFMGEWTDNRVLMHLGPEATQMVAPGHTAWHVEAFNDRSIGIELAATGLRCIPARTA